MRAEVRSGFAGNQRPGVWLVNGWVIAALCLAAASFAGCSRASLLPKLASPKDESTAIGYVALLRQSRFDQIESDMDPSLRSEGLRDTLVEMASMFPAEPAVSIKVVGMRTFHDAGSTSTDITLEYEFSDKWVLAEVATRESDGAVSIVRFNVTPTTESLEYRNRFTFVGKGVAQYAILFLAVLASGLNIYAFVVCLRTGLGKEKWFWAIATLFEIGSYGVDWTTGQSSFTPFAVHLGLASAAVAPPYGPWVVWVSFPAGAILFCVRRERMSRTVEHASDQQL